MDEQAMNDDDDAVFCDASQRYANAVERAVREYIPQFRATPLGSCTEKTTLKIRLGDGTKATLTIRFPEG